MTFNAGLALSQIPTAQGLGQRDTETKLLFGRDLYCPTAPRVTVPARSQDFYPAAYERRSERRAEATACRVWIPIQDVPLPHHFPVFGIEAHGSFGGNGAPFCKSSIECLSGERTNAITPSRGGRLMVTPAFIRRSHSE